MITFLEIFIKLLHYFNVKLYNINNLLMANISTTTYCNDSEQKITLRQLGETFFLLTETTDDWIVVPHVNKAIALSSADIVWLYELLENILIRLRNNSSDGFFEWMIEFDTGNILFQYDCGNLDGSLSPALVMFPRPLNEGEQTPIYIEESELVNFIEDLKFWITKIQK